MTCVDLRVFQMVVVESRDFCPLRIREKESKTPGGLRLATTTLLRYSRVHIFAAALLSSK